MPLPFSVLITAALVSSAGASFNVSNAFSSGAVLARDTAVTIFGFSDSAPPPTITANWTDGRRYAGTADASGVWRIVFPASPAVATPFILTFTSSAGDAVTLSDLLVGELVLCSGQCVRASCQASPKRAAPHSDHIPAPVSPRPSQVKHGAPRRGPL